MEATDFFHGKLVGMNVHEKQITLGFDMPDGTKVDLIILHDESHLHLAGAVRPLTPTSQMYAIYWPCKPLFNSGPLPMFEPLAGPQWEPDLRGRKN